MVTTPRRDNEGPDQRVEVTIWTIIADQIRRAGDDPNDNASLTVTLLETVTEIIAEAFKHKLIDHVGRMALTKSVIDLIVERPVLAYVNDVLIELRLTLEDLDHPEVRSSLVAARDAAPADSMERRVLDELITWEE